MNGGACFMASRRDPVLVLYMLAMEPPSAPAAFVEVDW